ncbi:MAG: GTP-binding protein [Clostridia bacterium]|nr:GTP-binding protein [Clostridia bacterium]
MTKVDIFSGFLGAGKTTLIKKLIKEAYRGEMIVVIENEFGKIGIDSGFLQEAGIQITEMNSGCICCSLVGDFGVALGKVKEQYDPDRIVIEPSGVGKLSDVIRAVRDAGVEGLELNAFTTVIDASKCAMYMKNFAEFYRNQIEFASSVIFSRTDGIREDKLADAERIVREINGSASLITTPWDKLDGRDILDVMEKRNTLEAELLHLLEEEKKKDHHHRHHHHEDGEECDDPECECHHHHDDDDDDGDDHGHHHHHHEDEHERHHHDDDDDDEDEHEHHHHHHHDDGEECDDPECDCHHHHDDDDGDEHEHHHHHHDHDADEVFTSWGIETAGKFSEGKIEDILDELLTGRYGMILRAKGIVDSGEDEWVHFDYVPGEKNVRRGPAGVTGKLCVIGTGLDKKGLAELFA